MPKNSQVVSNSLVAIDSRVASNSRVDGVSDRDSALVRHLTDTLSQEFKSKLSVIHAHLKDMEELQTQVQAAVWQSQENFQDQIQQRWSKDLRDTIKNELETQRKAQHELQLGLRKERRRD